ncbi:MAG: hypothetical protein AB1540_12765 [Bdellovibrionota bacterium]
MIFTAHLMFFPRTVLSSLKNIAIVTRASLFGIAQILLLMAQVQTQTSYMFLSAIFGNLIAATIGSIMLNERLSLTTLLGIFIAACGMILNMSLLSLTYLAILGGIVQGLTIIISAKIASDKKAKTAGSVAIGFLFSAVISFIWISLESSSNESFQSLNWQKIYLLSSMLILAQYAFFFLYRIHSIQRGSLLSLSRIPASMTLETKLGSTLLESTEILAATLLFIASSLGSFKTKPPKSLID